MFSKQNQLQIFLTADRGGRQRTEQHKLQRSGYWGCETCGQLHCESCWEAQC